MLQDAFQLLEASMLVQTSTMRWGPVREEALAQADSKWSEGRQNQLREGTRN